MPYFPLTGYAPDAEPSTQGIVVDVDLMVPTLNGLKALPSDSDVGVGTAVSAIRSAKTLSSLADVKTVYGGSRDNLFTQTGTGWNEVSAATDSYSMPATARWVFDAFNLPGNERVLAAAPGQSMQFKSGATFVELTNGPRASYIAVTAGFLMTANFDAATTIGTSSTVYIAAPNRWYCCGINSTTNWDTSIATQATTGLLLDSPGPITGLHKLGSNFVIYKERSMYMGQYVGIPQVWRWHLLPGEGLGCSAHHAVVDIETAHIFPGFDNFYIFDGSRPTPIATNRVAEFFLSDLNHEHKSQMVGHHDRFNWLVYWFYPSINSADGVLDKFLCYNYRSDRWGGGTKTVEFIFEWITSGVTYDGLGSLYSTYADLPTASYDEAFAPAGTFKTGVIGTDNHLMTLEGPGSNSSMRTWDIGVDNKPMVLSRARPRFKTAPTAGTQTHIYQDVQGGDETTGNASTTLSNGSFDYVFSARWHALKHEYTGDMEVVGLDLEMMEDGEE